MYQGNVDATITPAISAEAYNELQLENANLSERLANVQSARERALSEISEYRNKVISVKGVISDVWSEDGEIPDCLTEIARILEIELTKRISGTASFEISWSAQVPIDFDADDFEISFDVDCDTYEAENFDWQEENTEIHGEDE